MSLEEQRKQQIGGVPLDVNGVKVYSLVCFSFSQKVRLQVEFAKGTFLDESLIKISMLNARVRCGEDSRTRIEFEADEEYEYEFTLVPKRGKVGFIKVWNSWWHEEFEQYLQWWGNCGVVVEEMGPDVIRFQFSNGTGDFDPSHFGMTWRVDPPGALELDENPPPS